MADSAPRKITLSGVIKACLKLLIAAVLIGWIIYRDHEKIVIALSGMSAWTIAVSNLLVYLQISLTAKRWQWLIRTQGFQQIPYSSFFILTFQGCFANLFIPAGAVGGDIVKAALIAKQTPGDHKLEAAVSILTDRIVGMAGLFTISLVMFFICLGDILKLGPLFQSMGLIVALLCFAGLSAALVIFFQDWFFRWKLMAWLLALADRLLKGFPSRVISAVSAYRKNWRTLLFTTLFSAFILNPLMIGAMAVPLYAAARTAPTIKHVIAASSFGNTVSVIPLTPGGFGTRDKVSQTFLKAWGADDGAAATAVLVYTAVLLINYIFGGFFFLFPVKASK